MAFPRGFILTKDNASTYLINRQDTADQDVVGKIIFKNGDLTYGLNSLPSIELGVSGSKAGTIKFNGGTPGASAIIQQTDASLAIDAGTGGHIYLANYGGSGTTYIRNGAGTDIAVFSPTGITFSQPITSNSASTSTIQGPLTLNNDLGGTYRIKPKYKTYDGTNGVGDGGAVIVNSNESSYQALMIMGNDSAGDAIRRVKIWDQAYVAQKLKIGDLTNAVNYNLDVEGTAYISSTLQVNGNITANADINVAGNITFTAASGKKLDMNNNDILNVNSITIYDPGPNEGIKWASTAAGWTIDVAPDRSTNGDGDLNLYGTANNVHVWRPMIVDGSITINQDNVLSATAGNITLKHPTSGGANSIVFVSTVNPGSDYGYITYYDHNATYAYWGTAATPENSALVIGVQNDAQTNNSDVVVLKSPAAVIIDSLLLRVNNGLDIYGKFNANTSTGRVVLPVGTDMWAT